VQVHEHARLGNIPGVAEEFTKQVDVDAREDQWNFTPLMCAVVSDQAGSPMVRFLLERGADPNAVRPEERAEDHQSVLELALRMGTIEKITLLLDAGANARYWRSGGYDALIHAAYGASGDPTHPLAAVLRLLIDRGAKLDGVSDHGESALRIASIYGRFDAVQVLLDAGADASPLKWTPLMRAIAVGTLAEVRAQLGESPDLAARDSWERTAWLLSLQTGDVEKAKLLRAAGADPRDRGRCGMGPLMYPLALRHVEMLAWLLAEGFSPNDADDDRHTPLMEAARDGAIECVRVLLDAGADVHAADECEKAAISRAANLEIARLLIEHSADLNDINDELRAILTRLPNDGRIDVSRGEFGATKLRRFGRDNPETMNFPFWKAMVASGAGAWTAKSQFGDNSLEREEIFCFRRFGKSINELPYGRIIEIAGEHEDSNDLNFCIFNDVVVHHGDGTFDILGYPRDVFPPTDFHTATLVGQFIYIIGNLGYADERQPGVTPVYRLDIQTLAIERVGSSGDNPGWISQHKAALRGREIHIRGGKLWIDNGDARDYVDNPDDYVLDLDTFAWRRLQPRH